MLAGLQHVAAVDEHVRHADGELVRAIELESEPSGIEVTPILVERAPRFVYVVGEVARDHPDLVRAICEPNRDALLTVLDECVTDLAAALDVFEADDVLREAVGPIVARHGRPAKATAHRGFPPTV